MACVPPESGWIIHAWSNFPLLFLQRRPRSCCAELIRVWSGWPGQVLGKHIWSRSKPVCKNHRAQVLAEHNWPTTGFPLSDLLAFFNRWPGTYCAKLPGSNLVLADCVMFFAKRIRSGGKPVCKNHRARFWDQIQHVYWVNPADLIQGEFLLKAR